MRICLALLLVLGVATACDGPTTRVAAPTTPPATPAGPTTPPATPPATTPPATTPVGAPATTPAAAARVTLHRTGGFAGVDQTVVVESTGWTYQGTQRGQLTAAEGDRLRTLAADPALRTEAVRGRTPRECADAFEYTLTVDALAVTYVDCPPADTEQPVTLAIIDLLVAATPL